LQSIVINVCVKCLSVRGISPEKWDLYRFCACCLWPWLGPSASLRYVMYFRFCGWHVFILQWAICFRYEGQILQTESISGY